MELHTFEISSSTSINVKTAKSLNYKMSLDPEHDRLKKENLVVRKENIIKLNQASPSVIRKGLCMVRSEGKKKLFLI